MSPQEMQANFGTQINQFSEPLELDSDDIFYWLNYAQIEWVKGRYNGRNPLGGGFEQSQQLIDDLRVLYVKDVFRDPESNDVVITGYHRDRFTFPDNYFLLISSRSQVALNRHGIAWTGTDVRIASEPFVQTASFNRYAQSDDIFKLLQDPFNTTRAAKPLTTIAGNSLDVYSDDKFLTQQVFLNYLKKPSDITYDNSCELPEINHTEIVQLAVDLFLQNTRNLTPRRQHETPVAS